MCIYVCVYLTPKAQATEVKNVQIKLSKNKQKTSGKDSEDRGVERFELTCSCWHTKMTTIYTTTASEKTGKVLQLKRFQKPTARQVRRS